MTPSLELKPSLELRACSSLALDAFACNERRQTAAIRRTEEEGF